MWKIGHTLQRYNAQCFGQNWIVHVWASCLYRVPLAEREYNLLGAINFAPLETTELAKEHDCCLLKLKTKQNNNLRLRAMLCA